MRILGKNRSRVCAIIDMGSGSVGLAFAEMRAGEPARIILSERAWLAHEERAPQHAAAALAALLGETLENAAKRLPALSSAPVSELYAIVRAPWATSKTIRAISDFEQDTAVSGEMIASLARDALARDAEYARDAVLEASVVRVELNGYPTAAPEGKLARSVAVTVLLSECDVQMRAALAAALGRAFPNLRPSFRSGTRAILTLLRAGHSFPDDVLVAEIASEATTLTSVRGGLAANHCLVPEGSRSIVRKIAGNRMPEETITLIGLAVRDQCEDDACGAIKSAIARIEPELVRLFGEGMSRLAGGQRLPNQFLFIAEDDITAWLSVFFARIDFTQFTVTARPFTVQTLEAADLSEFVQAPVRADAWLLAEAALVNIEARS